MRVYHAAYAAREGAVRSTAPALSRTGDGRGDSDARAASTVNAAAAANDLALQCADDVLRVAGVSAADAQDLLAAAAQLAPAATGAGADTVRSADHHDGQQEAASTEQQPGTASWVGAEEELVLDATTRRHRVFDGPTSLVFSRIDAAAMPDRVVAAQRRTLRGGPPCLPSSLRGPCAASWCRPPSLATRRSWRRSGCTRRCFSAHRMRCVRACADSSARGLTAAATAVRAECADGGARLLAGAAVLSAGVHAGLRQARRGCARACSVAGRLTAAPPVCPCAQAAEAAGAAAPARFPAPAAAANSGVHVVPGGHAPTRALAAAAWRCGACDRACGGASQRREQPRGQAGQGWQGW